MGRYYQMVFCFSAKETIEMVNRAVRVMEGWSYYQKNFLDDVHMALHEAAANAYLHGGRGRDGILLRVAVAGRADCVAVTITDSGAGFNWWEITGRDCPEIVSECGRGIALMRKLMNIVRYNRRGNRVFLVKHGKGELK